MNVIEKVNTLARELPEAYQDIELDDKIIVKGKRSCFDRWDSIAKYIHPSDIVLDVGSSLGYFAHRIAKENPNSLVISFESDPIMCEIQASLYEAEGLYNVVICQHRLTLDDLKKWGRCVEMFDATLLLSVLHHFPPQEVREVWDIICSMSGGVFAEVPDEMETMACGGKAKQESRECIKDCNKIGMSNSHLNNSRRYLYLRSSHSPHNENLDAFIGVNHPDRHKFTTDYKWAWFLNDKNIIKGVNYHNLKQFNIVYPKRKWWVAQAKKAYEGLQFKSDVRAWNLLVTPSGLRAIDFLTHFPQGDQAEFRPEDLDNLV